MNYCTLFILCTFSMSFMMKGMVEQKYQAVVPISVINNSEAYAATVLSSTHHNRCYYATTLHKGQTFPPNDHTPNGISVDRPFKVITQKGPFILMLKKNKNDKPIFSIHREDLAESEGIIGEEDLQKNCYFRILVTVRQDGSLVYIKEHCNHVDALNSEYYGKVIPIKNYGF